MKRMKRTVLGIALLALLSIFVIAADYQFSYTGAQMETLFDLSNTISGTSGILESDGAGTITAATAGTDYYAPGGTDIPVTDGGTGVSTLTDGGVILGSGTADVTVMAVLTDGQMIVGDGATDPVAESGATLRTSIGVGTTDSPQLTAINVGAASDTTISRPSAGDIQIEANIVYRAGGTDVPVTDGGMGAGTHTDGGILVGAGTGAIEAVAVGLTSQILVGGGSGTNPAWGTDIPTAVTIGSAYIYRAGGTDVPDGDVEDDLTIASTKVITGLVGTVTDVDGFTMSAVQGRGYVVYATGAQTIVMPPAVAGANFSVECHAAAAIVLNPDASGTEDTIRLDGVDLTIGDSITSTSTLGDLAVCTYYAADKWSCLTNSWTDTN